MRVKYDRASLPSAVEAARKTNQRYVYATYYGYTITNRREDCALQNYYDVQENRSVIYETGCPR